MQVARFPHLLCPKSAVLSVSLYYLECESMEGGMLGIVGPPLTKTCCNFCHLLLAPSSVCVCVCICVCGFVCVFVCLGWGVKVLFI